MKKKTDELSRRQMLAAMAVSSFGVAKGFVFGRPKTGYHFSNSPNSKLVTISAKPAAIAIDTSKTTVVVMKLRHA